MVNQWHVYHSWLFVATERSKSFAITITGRQTELCGGNTLSQSPGELSVNIKLSWGAFPFSVPHPLLSGDVGV